MKRVFSTEHVVAAGLMHTGWQIAEQIPADKHKPLQPLPVINSNSRYRFPDEAKVDGLVTIRQLPVVTVAPRLRGRQTKQQCSTKASCAAVADAC